MLQRFKEGAANAKSGDRFIHVSGLDAWKLRWLRKRVSYCAPDPLRRALKKRGYRVVLCGSGPSLTIADLTDFDGVVVGINEGAVAREADFCFVYDAPVMDRIQQALRSSYGDLWEENVPHMIVDEEVWDQVPWVQKHGHYVRRKDLWENQAMPGSATACLYLLHQAGAKEIGMVGFDGWWAWTDKLELGEKAALSSFVGNLRGAQEMNKSVAEYDRIHQAMALMIESTGLSVYEVK